MNPPAGLLLAGYEAALGGALGLGACAAARLVRLPPVPAALAPWLALTRVGDIWVPYVATVTLLGANAGGSASASSLALALLANVLGFAFGFMFNDLEDAAEDASNPEHSARNPVAAGVLSARAARWGAGAAAAAAFAAYAAAGAAALGALVLALGFAYSWRPLRLKRLPGVDLLAHGLGGGALQCLSGAMAAGASLEAVWRPVAAVGAIGLYGELFNEVRDLKYDVASGIRHTAGRFGAGPARVAGWACLASAVWLLREAVLRGQVPLWVPRAGVGAVLACALAAHRSGLAGLHKPVLWVSAALMGCWAVSLTPMWGAFLTACGVGATLP